MNVFARGSAPVRARVMDGGSARGAPAAWHFCNAAAVRIASIDIRMPTVVLYISLMNNLRFTQRAMEGEVMTTREERFFMATTNGRRRVWRSLTVQVDCLRGPPLVTSRSGS
ncbi:hypothetical protein EVAR_7210_1 [Eumeta japonica]|uniref:Uncharacterized protein n=1 Tax=Eumeta variegata TaxID=151549 RepID=A0A4C1T563_EUMVA|nr:hypothetical protein EVAR_7210_1 [Eumeta japonica]